jgi:hypothetical protein
VAATLHNLAFVESAEGKGERAIELARRSLAIKTKLLGLDHPDTALTAMNLASLLTGDRAAESVALLRRALSVFERTLDRGHPHIGRCRRLLERSGG